MTENPDTPRWVPCPVCNGRPDEVDDERFGCDYCQGGGTVQWSRIGQDLRAAYKVGRKR